jgi:hypothetical protein
MPNSTPEAFDGQPQQNQTTAEMLDIDQWLEQLRQTDRSLYNLMALEVWAIARTMDGLLPGFWTRFMENRQTALHQFIQHHKDPYAKETETQDGPIDP